MSGPDEGVDSARTPVDRSASLTHGFLFADLRGYTSYLDRRGALAAAALLTRFRDLVRAAVAAHRGAEIRTEGDSFYVVFPSASMAVACALDIVRAAADEVVHPADPILVGVGVHAGEAVDTPDGPVGTAVNIAARLCAMAGPGQVVVSDTVRALTRSVGSAGFVSLGRRPIKGLDESLSLYRAVPAGTAKPSPSRRRRATPIVAFAGIGSALVLALALVALPRPPVSPGSSGSAVVGASARPSAASGPSGSPHGPSASPGYFEAADFAVPFHITLGRGWEPWGQRTDVIAWYHPGSPQGWIDVIVVAAVLDPPCRSSTHQFIGERPVDLIEWLTTRTWLDTGNPRPYNVGSYVGRAVEIEIPQRHRGTCEHAEANLFRLGGRQADDFGATWGAEIGERKLVIALDVHGRTVTLIAGSPLPSVVAFWRLTEPLLQSIEFSER